METAIDGWKQKHAAIDHNAADNDENIPSTAPDKCPNHEQKTSSVDSLQLDDFSNYSNNDYTHENNEENN